jgi:hypothetical protein
MAALLLFPGAGAAPVAHRSLIVVRRFAVGRRSRPPLRLTRRGRLLLRAALALLVGLSVAVAVLTVSRPAAAGTVAHPVVTRYHVVMPGETLWRIAADEVPGVDARDTAARIIELNQMPGSALQAGQRLALPVAG